MSQQPKQAMRGGDGRQLDTIGGEQELQVLGLQEEGWIRVCKWKTGTSRHPTTINVLLLTF